jgi:hypothetical protein
VIFWSIIDHARSAKDDRCELVCRDDAINAASLLEQAAAVGVQVSIYKSIGDVTDAPQAMLDEFEQELAVQDQMRAHMALEAVRGEIEKAVTPHVRLTRWDAMKLTETVRRFDRVELGAIQHVRAPFPAKAGPVVLSFNAEVRIHATVQQYPPPPSWELGVGDEVRESSAIERLLAVVEVRRIFTKHMEVEATAIRTPEGNYRDVKIGAVRPQFLPGLAGLADAPFELGDIADAAEP